MATRLLDLQPRQRAVTPARVPFELTDGLKRGFENAQAAVAEPFTGVTADGSIVKGLFDIARSGVSTEPIIAAATDFLGGLIPEQRERATFPLGASEWRQWSNIHPFWMRHGLLLEELDNKQREAAMRVLQATLSAGGYQQSRDIMRLNEYIGELTGGKWDEYGEWLYWVSVFGSPSRSAPWGWQIDGHHLIINCFVMRDQMVMTPTFMGSEPVTGESGKWAGIRVLGGEESAGEALWNALTPAQQTTATVGDQLPFNGMAAAFQDNMVSPYKGLRAIDMTAAQRDLLVRLIGAYTGHIRPGHSEVRMAEVQRHLDETYFGWIKRNEAENAFYYKVQNPVILIEFDHQGGVALGNDYPTRHHIHTVVRTPNGNDYGRDLLRLHYETSPHHR